MTNQDERKIKFKDLSIALKLGIIGGILSLVFYGITFMTGFFQGLLVV